MSNQLTIIGDTLRAPETTGKLMLALGYDDPKDAQAKNDAKRYAASVLAEIEKSAGTKQDLTTCSPHSIVQSMIDAAKFRIMIDGRQLAHLVKYGNNATLQIGYRGYIAKIVEHYDDADINVFPVYEGDTVTISGNDGFDRYTHDRADPFADGEDKFKGIVAALYYRKGDREFQKVITMTKREIMQIRKVAKQDYIWSAWFIEKAKAAAVKRICKLQFASLSVLQEMIAYDNRKHYDIEKPIEDVKAGSIIDNLNKYLENNETEDEEMNDVIECEIVEDTIQQSNPDLKQCGIPISGDDWLSWTDKMDEAQTHESLSKIGGEIAQVSDSYDQESRDKLKAYYADRLNEIKKQGSLI